MSRRTLQKLQSIIDHCLGLAALGQPVTRVLNSDFRRSLSHVNPMILPQFVLRPGGTVIDVGANVGNWTDSCRTLLKPQRIVCFEPQPSCAAILRQRFSHAPEVDVRALAIGRGEGRCNLQCWPASELSTTKSLGERGRMLHAINEEQIPTNIEVQQSSLDEELRQVDEIQILKVDVQGAEMDVVEGAQEVLNRTSCLVIEVLLARDYYDDSASCTMLLREIEGRTALRLINISRPAVAEDGSSVWADAVLARCQ